MLLKFLIIHLTISFLYFIYAITKKDKIQAFNQTIFVLFIPIIGICYQLSINVLRFLVRDSHHILQSYNKYVKNKFDNDVIEEVKSLKEINIVSVEEALIFNDEKEKRKILLDVLSGDYTENIAVLKTALDNEDTETSHYAASALMRIKSQLDEEINIKEVIYEKNNGDKKSLEEFINSLKKYISSELLDEFSLKKSKSMYFNLLKKAIASGYGNQEYYEEIIDYLLEIGSYQEARYYCQQYSKAYSEKEGSYLYYIKLYYELKNIEKLYENLDGLMNSHIVLTPKGLSILRFWLEWRKNAQEGNNLSIS